MTLKRNKNSLLVPQEQNRLCDYFYGSYIGFGAGGGVEADLTVGNAVILNDGDSANFSRTSVASPTNQKKWTYSTWVKRGILDTRMTFGLSVHSTQTSYMQFYDGGGGVDDKLYINVEANSGSTALLESSNQFRDTHAWYHIVVIYDSDNATDFLRIRLFVNGREISDYSVETLPSSGSTGVINKASATQYIGRQAGASSYFDGYLAQCVFCDGQAYTPDNFGKFNSKGVWVPKEVSTLTFGNNGFYLDFADSSDLGKDISGNGNDFTANNFASSDQTTDSPTLNWCTLTPVMSDGGGAVSLSEGNLAVAGTSATVFNNSGASFGGLSSGKWVWCTKPSTSGAGQCDPWVVNQDGWKHMQESDGTTHYAYIDADGFEISFDSASVHTPLTNGGSRSLSHTYGSDDMHLVAMDFDNNKLWFGVYDDSADTTSWVGTSTSYDGDPANGTNPTFTLDTPPYYWGVATYTGRNGVVDFGQGTLLDQITIPTGFKKLNSDNLPVPSFTDPTSAFQVITYMGTGANQTITMGGNSYGHRLGSGDRSSLIIATGNGGSYNPAVGTAGILVNGNFTDGPGITSYADDMNFKFEFPEAVNITEAMIHFQSAGGNLGTWKWQGSNNDSDWTDLSSNEDLTSCPLVAVITLDSIGASDTYTYYRIIKVSGGVNSNQWEEFSFKVKPTDNDRAVSTFKPDLVFIKNRDQADHWKAFDRVQTAESFWLPSDDANIATDSNSLTAFNTDGFTLGSGAGGFNDAGERFVAYCWSAGGGASQDNENGSINTTSQIVSSDNGFSISKWTGTGANATVGHGLSGAPDFFILKHTNKSSTFTPVYHSGLADATEGYLVLDTNGAEATSSTAFNSTAPTSTVVSFGTSTTFNSSSQVYYLYCWKSVDGFSHFGTFRGNANNNGVMVQLSFRPALVWIKKISSTGNWFVYDRSRSSFNETDDQLLIDSSAAETTGSEEIDFLSNGFKCRTSDSGINAGSANFIYCAWAESPFGGRGGVAGSGVTPARAV